MGTMDDMWESGPPHLSIAEDCRLLHACPHHAFVAHSEWEAIAADFAL